MAPPARAGRVGTLKRSRAITGRDAALRYARVYLHPPRYRPDQLISMRTDDGVRLSGAYLAGPPAAPATIVLVHGLALSSRAPRIHAFAHLLARHFDVVVPDLRGHGRSEGRSTLGMNEALDVAAAVASAPRPLPVVTMGISLGGAAVLLHAGTIGGVAGVVAVSAPAWSGAWDTRITQRIHRNVTSRAGRLFLATVLNTRIDPGWQPVPDSRQVAAAISPAFTLVIHDPHDAYFGEEHPRALYDWLRPPKELWWVEDRGHATDLLTPELADRLATELIHRLPSPSRSESPAPAPSSGSG